MGTSLNLKEIKKVIFIFTLLVGQLALAQTVNHKTNFYFYYGMAGLGSNLGSFMPTLRISDNKFTYTKEQNSSFGKRSKKKEFISKGIFRQSSIDSILTIVSGLKDSTIYKTNPCIMSGGITHIKIAYGTDTTKFILHNTSDSIAIKIIDIINPYLPADEKLYESVEEIKREDECRSYLLKKVKEQNRDRTNVKQ